MPNSGAGTIFEQGGGAETGTPIRKGLCQIWTAFFVPENSFSLKKGLRRIWTAFFVPEKSVLQKRRKRLLRIWTAFFVPEIRVLQKKGLRQISTVFLAQKIVLRVGTSHPRGAKIFPGGHVPPCPPTSRAYDAQ